MDRLKKFASQSIWGMLKGPPLKTSDLHFLVINGHKPFSEGYSLDRIKMTE